MMGNPVNFGSQWMNTGAAPGAGWSGLAGASTTADDASAATTPGNATTGGWGIGAMMPGCKLCQSPMFMDAVFLAAIVLFAVSWRAHLHSMLE